MSGIDGRYARQKLEYKYRLLNLRITVEGFLPKHVIFSLIKPLNIADPVKLV